MKLPEKKSNKKMDVKWRGLNSNERRGKKQTCNEFLKVQASIWKSM